MKPILLFDIDGTLLHVKRHFLKEGMSLILKNHGLNPEKLRHMTFAGRTDRDIFLEITAHQSEELSSGGTTTLYESVKADYLQFMLEELDNSHVTVIPGASEAIHHLQNSGYAMGLCTGNFREIAFKKMKAAGFDGHFKFGGFGCNYRDRIHLPSEADQNYFLVSGLRAKPEHYLVIGDTPNDIRCAKYFGARSVAVSTGSYRDNQLRAHKPDLLVQNLGNPDLWLSHF